MSTFDPRAESQARFARFSSAYVLSETHARGDDLDRLLSLSAPQPDWRALDIATGGGHTALKLAPYVHRVIAADIALPMLAQARQFHHDAGADNVGYVNCDAEALAFPDNLFDLVTCRIAPHHFPDAFRFVREAARVLKPGGRLVVQDQVLPADKRAAQYIEAFEKLRDPSHHRAFNSDEWQGMFIDAGLTLEAVEHPRKVSRLVPWAKMQECSDEVILRLQILLKQAPDAVVEQLRPTCAGTSDAAFDHVYVLLSGVK